MGRDKARLVIDGSTLAERTAALLLRVVTTALEVGPGVSALPSLMEEPPGEGPLAAIAEGRRALRERGHDGPALVVACDMPLLSERLLRVLVEWPSLGSVVPVVHGMAQPLCAKWGPSDLDEAGVLVAAGTRSLRHLSEREGVVLLEEASWHDVVDASEFADVDSPSDLERLGLDL